MWNWIVFNTFLKRFMGLMGRSSLADNTWYVIYPCSSIHTFWMRTPIDLAFFNKEGKVLATHHAVKSRRIVNCSGAFGVIEGKVGQLMHMSLKVNDRLPVDTFLKK